MCPDPATDPIDIRTPCLAIVSFDLLVSRDDRAVIVRGTGATVRFNFSIVDAAAVLVPNEAAYWALADDRYDCRGNSNFPGLEVPCQIGYLYGVDSRRYPGKYMLENWGRTGYFIGRCAVQSYTDIQPREYPDNHPYC